MRISQLLVRVLISCLLFALFFQLLFYLVSSIFVTQSFDVDWAATTQQVLNWAIIFLIWSLFYFIYHFFENFRKEEIKNLQWEAAKNEVELNILKSQLNPHFIFNSMNTIRALIDEDPKKAKKSITRLSNILRSSFTMGRQKTISLEEELKLVNDYLEIEKTRFEERLTCSQDIQPNSLNYPVPSMMLQTIVENAIKHGISKLPNGGNVMVRTKFHFTKLLIEVENDGEYQPNKKDTDSGYGLSNSRQRLKLLYGDDAELNIFNRDNRVITEVIIPGKTKI
jgi:LytS/YehU family sensor histidine kinase